MNAWLWAAGALLLCLIPCGIACLRGDAWNRLVGLEAAGLMVFKAAWLYDQGKPCGAEANSAKYLAGEACFDACQQAVMTHGGFGYAAEYHVERYLREALLGRIAPITPQLILCYVAERVLGLPKSY